MASYRGDSSLESFVTVVISNLGRDYRNLRWGKWCPSAYARREGPIAIRLEKLIHRDGTSPSEAARILSHRDDVDLTEADLLQLGHRLSHRTRRSFTDLDSANNLCSGSETDERLRLGERDSRLKDVATRLRGLLAELPDEDRLIVRMRYYDGLKVSEIARMLGLPQKPLYRRFERILKTLRRDLEVTDSDVPEWLAA